jgi:acetyltransferase-like isoleucine patch superfamily enzyme
MTSFYTEEELIRLGFKSYGKKVLISRKCSLYSPQEITIGDNVRIDDFCILSGKIVLGSNIHISPYCALYGANGIVLADYTGLSANVIMYSAMDDFSGNYLIGPIHPTKSTNVTGGIVKIERFVQVGSNSVVFPNLTISEGSIIGAMSLVNKSVAPWGIYVGIPVKKIKDRSKELLKFVI